MSKKGRGNERELLIRSEGVHSIFFVERDILEDVENITKPSTLSVYFTLCMLADNRDRESHPKLKEIAELARCSARTASRELNELVEFGYIRVEPRRSSEGRQSSNSYTILSKRGMEDD